MIVTTPKAKMDIFPNPAGEVLNVNITGYDQEKLIEVFDINGKKVMTETILAFKGYLPAESE